MSYDPKWYIGKDGHGLTWTGAFVLLAALVGFVLAATLALLAVTL